MTLKTELEIDASALTPHRYYKVKNKFETAQLFANEMSLLPIGGVVCTCGKWRLQGQHAIWFGLRGPHVGLYIPVSRGRQAVIIQAKPASM